MFRTAFGRIARSNQWKKKLQKSFMLSQSKLQREYTKIPVDSEIFKIQMLEYSPQEVPVNVPANVREATMKLEKQKVETEKYIQELTKKLETKQLELKKLEKTIEQKTRFSTLIPKDSEINVIQNPQEAPSIDVSGGDFEKTEKAKVVQESMGDSVSNIKSLIPSDSEISQIMKPHFGRTTNFQDPPPKTESIPTEKVSTMPDTKIPQTSEIFQIQNPELEILGKPFGTEIDIGKPKEKQISEFSKSLIPQNAEINIISGHSNGNVSVPIGHKSDPGIITTTTTTSSKEYDSLIPRDSEISIIHGKVTGEALIGQEMDNKSTGGNVKIAQERPATLIPSDAEISFILNDLVENVSPSESEGKSEFIGESEVEVNVIETGEEIKGAFIPKDSEMHKILNEVSLQQQHEEESISKEQNEESGSSGSNGSNNILMIGLGAIALGLIAALTLRKKSDVKETKETEKKEENGEIGFVNFVKEYPAEIVISLLLIIISVMYLQQN